MKISKKKRIKKACSLLQIFKKLKGNECQEILEYFGDDSIEFLCEILYNIRKMKFKMTPKTQMYLRRKMDPFNANLRKLAKVSESPKQIKGKRRILQKGTGFIIPLIASTVGPLLVDLISKSLKKK